MNNIESAQLAGYEFAKKITSENRTIGLCQLRNGAFDAGYRNQPFYSAFIRGWNNFYKNLNQVKT
jgi:hypothetical protein